MIKAGTCRESEEKKREVEAEKTELKVGSYIKWNIPY